MVSKISIQINNKAYDVRANASILQACEEVGIHLPRFCYHEKLSVAGNCRICLVEVEKSPKPVVACAMPVSKGMIIYTDSPLVKKVRESVLEFLLVNHPLDCPICDQGGECDLQDETLQFGSDRGRFYEFKRSVEDKEVGPIIKTIMTRCIHCTRCVRFSAEVAGQEVMGAFGRGEETEIGTYVQEFIKTELSGNLADICPVGALTSKPYAYRTRSWELQKVETIDFFDALCADIVVQTRKSSRQEMKIGKVVVPATTKEEIVRILPRSTGIYDDNWISDKTRYAFDSLRKQRLSAVYAKDSTVGYTKMPLGDMLLELVYALRGNAFAYVGLESTNKKKPIKVGAMMESLVDIEGAYMLNEVLKFYGSSNIQAGNILSKINFDIPTFYTLNRTVSSFTDLGALVMIGTNPRFEASILNTWLRKQQQSRDLSYFSIGNYNPLKLKDAHLGITPKALLSLVENRTNATKILVVTKGSSVLLGAETLKGINGKVLQTISRFFAKKLFMKTKNGERLGILQSNTTSMVANTLGIAPGVRSNLYVEDITDKGIDLLFAVQPFELTSKKWLTKGTRLVSFATHKSNNVSSDRLIPIKTFYEKNGFLAAADGRIRKFYKGVTPPERITTLEGFFATLMRAQALPEKWLSTLGKIWRIQEEVSLDKNLEKSYVFSTLFTYDIKESNMVVKNVPFVRAIDNFYNTDLLSSNSITMVEASLFLNKQRNFSSL